MPTYAKKDAQNKPAGEILRALWDSVPVGLLILDADGNPQHMNGTFATWLAEAPDLGTLLGFGPSPQSWKDAVLNGDVNAQTAYAVGERHLERRIVPLDGTGVLILIDDITQREQDRRAWYDRVMMIVHDLRGPLSSVQSGIRLMEELEGTDTFTSAYNVAERATAKLARMVDSLLDVSRMGSGHVTLDCEPVILSDLAEDVLLDLDHLSGELGVTIETDIAPDLPLLDLDRYKIERVLFNLLHNAVKYAASGERVTIWAYLSEDPAFAAVHIIDRGPGIPDDQKETLFDRFTQVEANGPRGRLRGTGLGLTFCRMAVEAHGGRIWIEDNPDGGSIFALTLPVLKRASRP